MSIRRAFFDKNQFFFLVRHILLVQHYEFSIFSANLDMVFQSSGVRASDDFLFLLQKILLFFKFFFWFFFSAPRLLVGDSMIAGKAADGL